ncbi:AGE family epimerase/isomerase [Paenibacillus filicis]|uniref:AGE family epimerase/isomerase n=1 Tax=Paenibacillus gyeongsangnamensis TaxID=3388067 RepID=A0ABT4Q777_9BACL|nr:AGE family epimerase/isomerase [Paenibacillus filicis]MCZ8512727.1 AGE family epimerase/isomerase [Paenibacillus filicis]
MTEQLDREALRAWYEGHLIQELLPFWMRALDERHGGVYTCFTNTGSELLSTDKYTWSQGRFIWLWSRIADLCGRKVLSGDAESFLEQAGKTVDFLKRHAMLDNGNCAFLLTEEGAKKESIPGQGYDTSFYADCFVVLGFSEYARVSGRADIAEDALRLYDRIRGRLQSGHVRSEPYPIPEGMDSHSVSMIMLNCSQQLMDALQSLGHPDESRVRSDCLAYAERILRHFLQPDGQVAELVSKEERAQDTLLCRHVNPGHTLESMWFVIAAAERLNRRDLIAEALPAVKRAFELGWDAAEGGLLRFVDREGGEPRGLRTGDPYERLILDTWDTKLWWPHSEALYSTLLAYEHSGDPAFLSMYSQAHDYVFRTFPNPDRTVGEWIQIRDRSGRPLNKVVALPVKDPFHIIRNVLLILELLPSEGIVRPEVI